MIRVLAVQQGELRRAQNEHHQLAAMFRSGDADGVGKLCGEHCAYTARGLLAQLRANACSSYREDPRAARPKAH